MKTATIVMAALAGAVIGAAAPALAQSAAPTDPTARLAPPPQADPLAATAQPGPAGAEAPPVDAPPAPPPRTLGPDIWRGARIGMGLADVQKLFPQAAPPSIAPLLAPTVVDPIDPTKGAKPVVVPGIGEVRADGSKAGLALRLAFAGGPALAQFYFKGDNLSGVIVDRRDIKTGRAAANQLAAHAVVDRLTSDYGPARRCVDLHKDAALTCDWAAGDVKIVASYRDIGGAFPTLSVVYGPLKVKKVWAPGPVKKLRSR